LKQSENTLFQLMIKSHGLELVLASSWELSLW